MSEKTNIVQNVCTASSSFLSSLTCPPKTSTGYTQQQLKVLVAITEALKKKIYSSLGCRWLENPKDNSSQRLMN